MDIEGGPPKAKPISPSMHIVLPGEEIKMKRGENVKISKNAFTINP